MTLTGYTDYPFTALGDEPYVKAPVRACEAIEYDRDKYLTVSIGGQNLDVKAGYFYKEEGRCGDAPTFSHRELCKIPPQGKET